MQRMLLSILALTVLCFSPFAAHAQEGFQSEKFYIAPEFGAYGSPTDEVDYALSFGGSAGYFITDMFSVGLEANGYYMGLDHGGFRGHQDASGFGFNGLVRVYPIAEDQFRLYVGTGLGGLFLSEDIHYGEESSFFTLPVDLGVTMQVHEQVNIDLGGRYQRVGFTHYGADLFGGRAAVRINF